MLRLSSEWSFIQLKAPDRCAQLFDREHFLITDKHTEVLDCISCVIKVIGQTVQMLERPQTDGQTDGRTDRRYQTYYLPCFAVDNE